MRRKTSSELENDPDSNIQEALGVKGMLRVRPYGNVKHAHVVLRMVGEEEYVDAQGKNQKRAIFSLFAHKLINVKPGKELFLYLHPAGGELQERVVALEADIATSDEPEVELVKSMKSEATLVQPEQLLPPRMRKHWIRKPMGSPVQQPALLDDTPRPPPSSLQPPTIAPTPTPTRSQPQSQAKVATGSAVGSTSDPTDTKVQPSRSSIGIQAELHILPPEPSSSSITLDSSSFIVKRQGRSSSRSSSKRDASTQTPDDSIIRPPLHTPVRPTTGSNKPATKQTSSHERALASKPIDEEILTSKLVHSIASSIASTASPSRQRTLSPMEIDSNPTSPDYSPEQFCVDLTIDDDDVRNIPPPKQNSRETEDSSRLSSAVTLVNHSPPSKTRATPQAPISISGSSSSAIAPATSKERPSNAVPESSEAVVDGAELRPQSANGTPHSSYLPHTSAIDTYSTNTQKTLSASEPAPFKFPLIRQPTAPRALANMLSQPPRSLVSNAPKFVPATSLSQPFNPSHTQTEAPRNPPLALPLPPSSKDLEAPQEANASLKRSRPSDDVPDRAERVTTPSKKWKPIVVKAEPMSPVLSFSQPVEPIPDNLDDVFGPPSHSQEGSQSITHVPVLSATDWPEALQIKAEALDINLHAPVDQRGYGPSSWTRPSDPYNNPYAEYPQVIDLTNDSASSRMNSRRTRNQRHGQGFAHKLFARYSAHLKMKTNIRESGIRDIVFDGQGLYFAIICRDCTVRVWDNVYRTEIAKLSHSSNVVAALWLESGKTIASLGTNGVVSKWTMVEGNRWDWDRLVDTGDSEPCALAYSHGRIAVAHARKGIKLWELNYMTGTWEALDRNVPRKDIATIKFTADGTNLLCGSFDGSVFRVTVPRCRVLPVTATSTKCFAVDIDHSGTHALVAEASGRAILLELSRWTFEDPHNLDDQDRDGARMETRYSLRDAENRYGARAVHAFGAFFAGRRGEYVVFGSIGGRVLVWDREKGMIRHEMDHGPGVMVQAVAFYDSSKNEAQLLSCTRKGKLTWWDLPDDAPYTNAIGSGWNV